MLMEYGNSVTILIFRRLSLKCHTQMVPKVAIRTFNEKEFSLIGRKKFTFILNMFFSLQLVLSYLNWSF